MADRTAADIFGKVFDILAKTDPSIEICDAAEKIWDQMAHYDFQARQLNCDDDSLIALGLAKLVSSKTLHEKFPNEGYDKEEHDILVYIGDEIWMKYK
jgi:hypothetical protein